MSKSISNFLDYYNEVSFFPRHESLNKFLQYNFGNVHDEVYLNNEQMKPVLFKYSDDKLNVRKFHQVNSMASLAYEEEHDLVSNRVNNLGVSLRHRRTRGKSGISIDDSPYVNGDETPSCWWKQDGDMHNGILLPRQPVRSTNHGDEDGDFTVVSHGRRAHQSSSIASAHQHHMNPHLFENVSDSKNAQIKRHHQRHVQRPHSDVEPRRGSVSGGSVGRKLPANTNQVFSVNKDAGSRLMQKLKKGQKKNEGQELNRNSQPLDTDVSDELNNLVGDGETSFKMSGESEFENILDAVEPLIDDTDLFVEDDVEVSDSFNNSPTFMKSRLGKLMCQRPESVASKEETESVEETPVIAEIEDNSEPIFDYSLYEIMWWYKDPNGDCQGPFKGIQMNKWYASNFFPDDLLLKYEVQMNETVVVAKKSSYMRLAYIFPHLNKTLVFIDTPDLIKEEIRNPPQMKDPRAGKQKGKGHKGFNGKGKGKQRSNGKGSKGKDMRTNYSNYRYWY